MNIKIKTEMVATAANTIAADNKTIFDEFAAVKTAINNMDNCWHGSAATAAITAFNNIEATFRQTRYDSVNVFVRFLREQVGQTYEETESELQNAAKAFK